MKRNPEDEPMNRIKRRLILLTTKATILWTLCRVHDYTRYKPCRSLQDLFYWPNGICLDTAVVFAAIITALLVAYDELKMIQVCGENLWQQRRQ